MFNFPLLILVFAFMHNSQVQSSSKHGKTTKTTPYLCPRGEGLYPNSNPKKCHKFFSCPIKGQRADYLSCPEGYNFDSFDRICKPQEVAKCDLVRCSKHGDLFVDELDSFSYLKCEHGLVRRMRCEPPGTYFDHHQGICDRPVRLVYHHHDQNNSLHVHEPTTNSINQTHVEIQNTVPSPKSNQRPNANINYNPNKISQKDKFNMYPANKKASAYYGYTVHDKHNTESEEKRLRHAMAVLRKNLTRLLQNDTRFVDEDYNTLDHKDSSNINIYVIVSLAIVLICVLVGFFYFLGKNYIGPKFKCDLPPSLSTSDSRVQPRIVYANGLGLGQSNSNNHANSTAGENRQKENDNRNPTISNSVRYMSNPGHGIDPIAKII